MWGSFELVWIQRDYCTRGIWFLIKSMGSCHCIKGSISLSFLVVSKPIAASLAEIDSIELGNLEGRDILGCDAAFVGDLWSRLFTGHKVRHAVSSLCLGTRSKCFIYGSWLEVCLVHKFDWGGEQATRPATACHLALRYFNNWDIYCPHLQFV